MCPDHNILFVPYFSADEGQTFDAIVRNDEGAIEGVSPPTALTNSHGHSFVSLIPITHLG